MQDTTKDTWQENVLDQPLVLVYFWAAWCRPCKMQAPVLEQLEQDIATLSIAKIDADANPGLVEELAISSIPTLILYKNGEHVWTKTGAKPRGVLIEDIAPFV
jgi:thioredoxin 1